MIITKSTLSYKNQIVPPLVPAVQGDTGRHIIFTIKDYEIPEGATATFYIQKPSKEAVYNTATLDASNNTVEVELTAQCLAEYGENFGQIRIMLDGEVITSFDFILLVKAFRGIDAIESTSESNIFDQAVEAAAEQFQTEAEAIVDEVIESIPEDYSALSQDVTDLKADLSHTNERLDEKAFYNNMLNLEWTSGYRIAPNGTVASSSASSATLDYYKVSAGDIIIAYLHSPGSANVIALYNNSKMLVDTFTVSNTFAPKKYLVEQDGYIRFSNEFSVIANPYVIVERAYKSNDELETSTNELNARKANVTNEINLEWTSMSRIGIDGGFYPAQSTMATKGYYFVHEGDVIEIGVKATGVATVSLYDEMLQFVSYFNVTAPDYLYTVPQNGYMRFSNDVSIANPYVKFITEHMSIEEIEGELDDIKESIGETVLQEYTHTITGIVMRIPKNTKDATISPLTNVVIVGHNLLDNSSYKANTIINDAGNEVSDASSFYFDCLIPIKNISRIFTNIPVQRFYYYNQNGQFLGRSQPYGERVTSRPIPLIENLAYIKIQSSIGLFSGDVQTGVVSLDGNLEYTPYKTNSAGTIYDEGGVIYNTTFTELSLTYTDNRVLAFPSFWQPVSADSGYSMPIGLSQALRSNWTAEDKYHYYDFLNAKFDKYLGYSSNGYSVTKRFMGQDSKHTGYELVEYTFTPKHPKHTVLLSSAMNSNEIVTVWGIARLIQSIMDEDNTVLKAIKDTTKIIILPFICPSSFDTEPMNYYNANGVRVNKNFNYITSWTQITGENNPKGDYPDSEIETQILKEWVNAYAYKADLWIDCHSDHTPMSTNQHRVCYVFASDDVTLAMANLAEQRIKDYYVSAGTANALTDQVFSAIEPGNVYPKTLYGYYMCGIPSIMLEQTVGTTIFGSNGSTINDVSGIKNYTAMLYMLINTLLSK